MQNALVSTRITRDWLTKAVNQSEICPWGGRVRIGAVGRGVSAAITFELQGQRQLAGARPHTRVVRIARMDVTGAASNAGRGEQAKTDLEPVLIPALLLIALRTRTFTHH